MDHSSGAGGRRPRLLQSGLLQARVFRAPAASVICATQPFLLEAARNPARLALSAPAVYRSESRLVPVRSHPRRHRRPSIRFAVLQAMAGIRADAGESPSALCPAWLRPWISDPA